ncbi:MAG: Neuraminidase (sialidase) [Patescibacteria group bacterium]|jgi:Neuraminidase (sialidase)
MKGEQALYAGPNPNGMLGKVWVATDHSDGPSRGYDNNDPAGMMFSRSTDGGLTWSEAIQINTDDNSSNWQWFGSMSVAPNGRIDVTWLDTRDDPGTVLSSLYYASSFDGGLTWTENERLSDAFDPHLGWPNQNKIGDYNHMISDNEGAHLAWAATFNEEQDVYYSFIEAAEVPLSGIADLPSSSVNGLTVSVYPNPIEAETTLSIFSNRDQYITLTLHDLLGRPLGVLADKNFSSGTNELLWAPEGLIAGTYFLQAENELGEKYVAKIVIIEQGK